MQETQETWVWSLGQEDPQEKKMTSHPSILAWIISWTEEPGDWTHTWRESGLESWSCHLVDRPKATACFPLKFCFLICKMGILTSTSRNCYEGSTQEGQRHPVSARQCWLSAGSESAVTRRRAPRLKLIVIGFAGETPRGCALPSSRGLDYAWLRVPVHGGQPWHNWGMSLSLLCADGRPDSDKRPCVLSTCHSRPVGKSWTLLQAPAQKRGEEHFLGYPVPLVVFFPFERGSTQYHTELAISTTKAWGSNF